MGFAFLLGKKKIFYPVYNDLPVCLFWFLNNFYRPMDLDVGTQASLKALLKSGDVLATFCLSGNEGNFLDRIDGHHS